MGSREPSEANAHAGWRTRGYLPHYDEGAAVQHVVFRLADALPSKRLAELERAPGIVRLEIADKALDQGIGSCALRNPLLAGLVQRALRHFDGERYRLVAWCVMPTHVHVLFAECEGWTVSQVVQGWKSYTAHQANRITGRRGSFWSREYFDRWMRDDDQLEATRAYIENNPVAASLCPTAESWPWSSASE